MNGKTCPRWPNAFPNFPWRSICWWWMTIRPMAQVRSRTNWPQKSGRFTCCIARRKTVWAALIVPASPGRWSAITSSSWKWTAIFPIIPTTFPRFVEAAQDADLVLGSRYCNGIRVINWPLKRLLLSTSAARYVRIITGMPFTDPTGGFKCFRRRALQSIDLDAVRSNGYSFQIELTHKIWRQGMKIVEIPIIFTERSEGQIKNVAKNRLGSAGDGLAASGSKTACGVPRRQQDDPGLATPPELA